MSREPYRCTSDLISNRTTQYITGLLMELPPQTIQVES